MMLINLLGVLLIGLITWWFWFYKPPAVALGENELVITVEAGSYSPAHLTLPCDRETTLIFLRKDPSPCAEIMMIPQLDINQTLPLNKPLSVQLPKLQPGEYAFHCQMQMYRGTLIVA